MGAGVSEQVILKYLEDSQKIRSPNRFIKHPKKVPKRSGYTKRYQRYHKKGISIANNRQCVT
jgi:hypothetical protein